MVELSRLFEELVQTLKVHGWRWWWYFARLLDTFWYFFGSVLEELLDIASESQQGRYCMLKTFQVTMSTFKKFNVQLENSSFQRATENAGAAALVG